ncbi:MAG: ATP-binding cassette domain-containing protein [Actinomycetota bacterium]
MIVAEELSKTYRVGRGREITALDDLNLEVARGELRAILGPNGAGKSTAVKIFTTLTAPTWGRASISGIDVSRDPGGVRELIGASGQSTAIDERLTGLENLQLIAMLSRPTGLKARDRAADMIERFDLVEARDRQVKEYSGGMRRRVDIAGALLAEPEVLFLDEPTTGLDPRSRQSVWDLIAQLAHRGTTVVLTTQYLEEADRLSDTISVIDHGRVIAEGTPDELKASIGEQRAEVTLLNDSDHEAAMGILRRVAAAEPARSSSLRDLSVAITDGTRTLSALLLELGGAGIELVDAGVRRPTLDEVFFELTGTPPTDELRTDPR